MNGARVRSGTVIRARRLWLVLPVAALVACARTPRPLKPAPRPAPEQAATAEPAAALAPITIEERLAARAIMVPVHGIAPEDIGDTFDAPRGDRTHRAVDIPAPRGTPVLAADHGYIFKLRTNSAGGTTIYTVDTERRFVYYYAHLERYRDGLAEGDSVTQGDIIGYVGTTGNAPQHLPHLHFQIMEYRSAGQWWDGNPINPLPYFAKQGQAR